MRSLVLRELTGDRLLQVVTGNAGLLETLAGLAERGGELAEGELRERLGAVLDQASVDRIMEELGDALPSGEELFAEVWQQLFPGESGAKAAKRAKAFAMTLRELAAKENAGKRKQQLPLLDMKRPTASAGEPRFSREAGAEAKFIIDMEAPTAAPSGLDGGAGAPEDLVRLGAAGRLVAESGLGGEVPGLSFELSGGAEGGGRLDLYGRVGWECRYLDGVGKTFALAARRSLLRIDELARLFRPEAGATALAAVAFTTEQSWRFSSQIGVSRQRPLDVDLLLNPSLKLGFEASRTASYRYLLRPHAEGVQVDLERLRGTSDKSSESWAVDLDLGGLADRIYPEIEAQLGDQQAEIKRVLAALPKAGAVRTALSGALEETLKEYPHKELLIGVIGLGSKEVDVDQRIGRWLAERVERQGALWDEAGGEAVDSIVNGVRGTLPWLPDDAVSALDEALREGVAKGLEALDAKLKKGLAEVTEGDAYQEMVAALGRLGEGVGDVADEGDARLQALVAPVRKVLAKYQRWIAKLSERLQSAAARKIELRFAAEEEQTVGERFALSFVIRPMHPRAQELFVRMLAGDVAPLFDALGETRVDGPLCCAKGSSLTHYRRLKESKSYAAVLLGFDLAGGSLLDVDTEVTVDSQGDLQILSKMSYDRYWSFMSRSRGYRFVDVYRLAAGAAEGGVSLSMGISTKEDGLKKKEVKAFFEGLERFALIAPGGGDAAAKALDELSGAQFKQARLDTSLTLTAEQGAKLLSYGEPVVADGELVAVIEALCTGNGGTVALSRADEVRRQAAAAIEEVLALYPVDPAMAKRRKMYRESMPELGLGLREMVLNVDDKNQSPKGDALKRALAADLQTVPDIYVERDMMWLAQRNRAASRLAGVALPALWAVANASRATKDPKVLAPWLESAQHRVGNSLGTWFDYSGQLGWSFNLDDTVRPLTLALFRTVALLADTDPTTPGPSMSASLVVLDGKGREAGRRLVVG